MMAATENLEMGIISQDRECAGTDASTDNIFIGYNAGSGDWVTAVSNMNVGIGNYTLDAAMDAASWNTAIGQEALSSITTADSNTAVG